MTNSWRQRRMDACDDNGRSRFRKTLDQFPELTGDRGVFQMHRKILQPKNRLQIQFFNLGQYHTRILGAIVANPVRSQRAVLLPTVIARS